MGKVVACEYGKQIKRRLIDLDRTQNWLIDEVKDVTGLYFDSWYLHKVITGKINTPKIVTAINQILELGPKDGQDTA